MSIVPASIKEEMILIKVPKIVFNELLFERG
jgi:hypothetical protein